MDVNEELKFLRKFKKKNFFWGGGGSGQGGCERKIEVFVKIKNYFFFFFFFGGGGGVRVDVNEELKFLRKFKKKIFFCVCVGGGGGGGGRVRVDVNEKLKFL